MKIILNENANIDEAEVVVNCCAVDDEIRRLLALLHAWAGDGGAAALVTHMEESKRLTGNKNGKTYVLQVEDVLYFDTVDKRAFIYTADDVYETGLKLYELEERFGAKQFFRSSKSAIVNIDKIKTIEPDFGGRLEITMMNGERLSVSRQYAQELKTKIGL